VDILDIIRRQAKTRPTHLAFARLEGDERVTYGQLIERADRVAQWLTEWGCRAGERCGLILGDGADFLESALGVLKAGLCLVPIATFWPEKEKDFAIKAAAVHWLLREDHRLLRLPFADPVDDRNDDEFRACDPAYIRFTSGTTGLRKGILLGHQTILDRLDAANAILQINSDDRIWFALPMADHFIASILLYLSRGATVLTASTSANRRQIVNGYRPTIIYGSPDFYQDLIRSDIGTLDTVRLAISTTAPLPEQVAEDFAKRFSKNLNPALGIIEVGLLTLNTRSDKAGSVGLAMPAYTVTLVGKNGTPMETEEIGELHINGPGLLDAYLAPWRPVRRLLEQYGYPTGDFAWIDQDGYLFLAGRGKNQLQINGIQFFCEEVETILNTLPGIEESRVYFDSTSQTLSAELVGSPGPTERLSELLLQKIDPRKVPARFQIVEDLPRTPSGKLRRSE
jgi:long-chain acyl-CoA synthetase